MKASIIIPTRSRHHLFPTRLDKLMKYTPEIRSNSCQLIIVLDEDEEGYTEKYVDKYGAMVLYTKKLETPANKWNLGARYSSGEWLVTLSDDSEVTPQWLSNAFRTLNRGFLGLPDQNKGREAHFCPLYMATVDWLKAYNGGVLVIPKYGIWYADIETCERAKRSNTYFIAQMSLVKNLHYLFNNAPVDEIYKIGEKRRHADQVMYEKRMREGFPNDFEGVL